MKNRILTLMMLFFAAVGAAAEDTKVIYVCNNTATNEYGQTIRTKGDDTKDGSSWANAKEHIQAAIEALGSTGGEVWVATGTYYPDETSFIETQEDADNSQYRSFKIPANVTVRGGFIGNEESEEKRVKNTSKVIGSYYVNQTILSGDLSQSASSPMKWSYADQQYKTSFSGNSFHVVWMADINNFTDGRCNGITGGTAKLEGCTVTCGNAYYLSTTVRDHIAYGGGIYMTKGAEVENCYVTCCSATRAGGGIFMDGGGTVTHTAITKCQSLGIGINHGQGGGIYLEGNGANTGLVTKCGISGCVGRLGGGLAIKASSAANKDAVKASLSVIVNNTATTEGGGVYSENGGRFSHLTVARNKCNGSGVYMNGMTTGRSAGIYCRDNATIVNSVFWGGGCKANNDVQYANSCSDKTIKVDMRYVALSNSSYIDWSTTTKVGITKLSKYNNTAASTAAGATASRGEGFPLFTNVSDSIGATDITGQNLNIGEYNLWQANWDPMSNSTVNNEGIDNLFGEGASVDMREATFSPRCTLGAYSILPATIYPEETETGKNIYVDPDAQVSETATNIGSSWDNAVRFLGEALDYAADNDASEDSPINIYVKEGTVDNTRYLDPTDPSSKDMAIRDCALDVPSFVRIYGGYSSELTGTDLSSRNPVLTPTIITANIDDTYSGNAKTLLNFDGVEGVVVDGFQLRYANNDDDNGGAMKFLSGSSVTVKNCLVAGCMADNGAAVYSDSEDNDISFENCIFHNNETVDIDDEHAIVLCEGGNLKFDHCDFLHNVGYAIGNTGEGTITVDNSVFYANMSGRGIDDTNGSGLSDVNKPFFGNNFDSDNKKNLFDAKAFDTEDGNDIASTLVEDIATTTKLTYTYDNSVGTTYPLFMNSTKNAGVPEGGYYSDATYYGRATSFQPLSLNPMVNAAYYAGTGGFGKDMTTVITRNYGGLPDIGAVENHYAEDEGENSNKQGQLAYGKVIYVRDYDGDLTKGGDGYSWTNAINGNAYYDEYSGNFSGETSAGETSEYPTEGWVYNIVESSTSYIDPENGDYFKISFVDEDGNVQYIKLTVVNSEGDYNNDNSNFKVTTTTDPNRADAFQALKGKTKTKTDSEGNAVTVQLYDMYDVTLNKIVNFNNNGIRPMDYGDNYYAQSYAQDGQWTFNSDGTIESNWGGNDYWWNIVDNILIGGRVQSKALKMKIYKTTKEWGTVYVKKYVNYMRGLQYAVNRASTGFVAESWKNVKPTDIEIGDLVCDNVSGTGAVLITAKNYETWYKKTSTVYGKDFHEVWVGAGTYKKDNETNSTATGLYSLDTKLNIPDSKYNMSTDVLNAREACDESCFIIRDGVNVFGAFPKEGNPGKQHRHPLVSQYVHVEGDYDPSDYETILQPITTSLEYGKVRRVLGQALKYNVGNETGSSVKELKDNGFKGATWDGFTIRYGNVDAATIVESRMNGGAGVSVYQNATVKNCVITENTQFCRKGASSAGHGWRGGGVFVQGGTVTNCYIINNRMYSLTTKNTVAFEKIKSIDPSKDCNTAGNSAYGAGIYFYHGTVYNCVIANNVVSGAQAFGAGVFMDQIVNFFNNTVVNNRAYNGSQATGGVAVYTNTGVTTIAIYNSIIVNNENYKPYNKDSSVGDKNISIMNGGNVYVTNCLLDNINSAYDPVNSDLKHFNCQYLSSSDYSDLFRSSIGSFTTDPTNFKTLNLRIQKSDVGDLAINKGQNTPVINGVTYDLSTYTDMDYKDRIQDCTIDIGAYEYNNANDIVPTVSTDASNKAIAYYYVTPEGKGNATATDPANAACADKFQSVLDAAGRYKYANPSTQVVVKVANSKSYQNAGENFLYKAKRTTDLDDDDARVWSIQVPRGVEVWGGYSDAYTSATDNGFTADRDVLGNPTYFDSYYYNKTKEAYAYTYHVLTFTDKVFDIDGNPIAGESLKDKTSDRAIVDGIFITGGKADVQRTTNYNSIANINSYGGAAIVTDFAHVRNCIVRSNEGTYGGALALAGNALVSGCLIDQNTAEYGGGIYVIEDGTTLSDGTEVNTAATNANGTIDDSKMAHVYTSTVVNNLANTQGGGMWFSNDVANVRVSSSLFWQNDCKDEADVSGLTNPSLTEADANTSAQNFYPFSYSAFLNKTVAGVNNRSVKSANEDGVRFATDETATTVATIDNDATGFKRFKNFGYYKPMKTSVLLRRGMSLTNYNSYVTSKGLSAKDFSGILRSEGNRQYIDIGARVCVKDLPNGPLMLRIFVAQEVNTDAQAAMMSCSDTYYQQEGSSFAYPMTDIQDAFDYIALQRQNARTTTGDHAKAQYSDYLPFEVIISGGNYTPSTSISGSSDYTTANTFVIPEGVSIYGGFNATRWEDAKKFYGKRYDPKEISERHSSTTLTDNITEVTDNQVTVATDYTILQSETDDMLSARQTLDFNANKVIEPWELSNETTFDGNPNNTDNKATTGTYHIVTIVPDAKVVGYLPPSTNNTSYVAGKTENQTGQAVVIDGITFKNGYGHGYQNNSLDANASRTFFQGGAILVDGNRYCPAPNSSVTYYSTSGITDGVGYRDIPVYIAKCKFLNNKAGFGGAVATNTSTSLFSDYFAENLAEAKRTTADYTVDAITTTSDVQYPGVGGAIYYTSKLYAVNSLFANNEAADATYSTASASYTSFDNSLGSYVGGVGGAMFGGTYSQLYMANCNIVRNQANMYPALFTLNPNADKSTNEVVNSVIWGNEQHANATKSFAGGLITNYGLKARTTAYTFSSAAPASQAVLDGGTYSEMTWFSAYESGRGTTPVNTVNNIDKAYNITDNLVGEQNSNVTISSTNNLIEGPNFTNPSEKAGYENFYEGAQWNPMRLSNLADNGSGSMGQYYDKSTSTFNFGDASGLYAVVHDVVPSAYQKYMPIGTDKYMVDVASNSNINRISLDYKLNSSLTHIDIGCYEYMHSQLKYDTDGSDVDVIWVAYQEKEDGHDGSSWWKPTTDIQGAIYECLRQRNGHRKEIRFESLNRTYGGSEFSAIAADADGNYSFTIDTKSLNDAQVIDETLNADLRYVTSLTFKGGYSYNDAPTLNASNKYVYPYDVYKYPAIIRAKKDASAEHCNHLFYIKDATQRYGLDDNYVNVESKISDKFSADNGYGWWPDGPSKEYGVAIIPIEFDGLTMINSQASAGSAGSAVYYADQKFDAKSELTTSDSPAFTAKAPKQFALPASDIVRYALDADGNTDAPVAKLIISKCKILGSGNEADNTVSAVYVGQYGGDALIYNSVFHSNYGNPLVAYDAQTINNTFAMNAGKVDLMGTSSVLNSLLWKNNSNGDQFTGATTFNHNAYTSCPLNADDDNVSLSDDNSDVINGPNFIDPENTTIEKRDFSINPAVPVFEKGLNDNYNNTFSSDASNNIYDYAIANSTGVDAKGNTRIANTNIDLGAYEFQSALAKVVYVDPNYSTTAYSGTSWTPNATTGAGPMGRTQLQAAIDLAAVYTATSASSEPSYVFVKGFSSNNDNLHTNTSITLRNGVQIYGCLPYDYAVDYTGSNMVGYVKTLLDARNGIAGSSANKVYVKGITTGNVAFSQPTVVDGLVVSPSSTTDAAVTSAVVNITPSDNVTTKGTSKLVFRNLIVNDFTASNCNLVNIDKALLYEALMRDNKVTNGSVLNLGDNAYAVNVTVEGVTTGSNVYNSIVNFTDNDVKTLSGALYPMSNKNLNYQLTEGSLNIDACDQSQEDHNPAVFLPENLKTDALGNANIAYGIDRDLLGNPRLLTSVSSADKVDAGAFETWRVDKDVTTSASKYPHDGSVVYVMDGKNLVCGTTFTPGYLLLKDGASLYGNGQTVNVAYVAVERSNIKKSGSVVSFPYAMKYGTNVSSVTTDSETGVTTLDQDGAAVYTYDSDARASWKYTFATKESECWVGANKDVIDANDGVLYIPNQSGFTDGDVLRFTGKGETATDYIYQEGAADSKTVTLKVNNDTKSTSGAADFTSKENMGWNCIGLPYLVSDYKPFDLARGTETAWDASDDFYFVDAPHKMWLYYDGTTSPDGTAVDGKGGYYSVSSWDSSDWHTSDARVWAGEGFFVQTARLTADETLTFYRPVYSGSAGAAKRVNARYLTSGSEQTEEEMIADESASDVKVYVQKHTLYVKNITDGADIAVYMTNGKAELTDHTENNEYSVTLENGVHIVKVNGKSFKVYVK